MTIIRVLILSLTLIHLNVVKATWLKDHYGRGVRGTTRTGAPQWIAIDRRPSNFRPGVEDGFRLAAFNYPNLPLNLRPVIRNVHSVDHVYAWSNIAHDISNYLKIAYDSQITYKQNNDFVQVREFLTRLFKIDLKAIVNRQYQNPPQPRIAHADYLNENDANLGDAYEGPNDPDNGLNHKLREEALQELDAIDFHNEHFDPTSDFYQQTPTFRANWDHIRNLLEIANSAPANLRYGHAKTNSAIQDNMDPMGGKDGHLTQKEKDWYNMATYLPEVYQFNNLGYLKYKTTSEGNIYQFSSYDYNGYKGKKVKQGRFRYDRNNGVPMLMSSTGGFNSNNRWFIYRF